MSFDDKKNLARTYIAVAPAPALTGLTFKLAEGGGAKMATPPFEMTIWPPRVVPSLENAEIAPVESINGDMVTLAARGHGGTTAKAIEAGWQVAAAPTVKTFTDIEEAIVAGATGLSAEIARAKAEEAALAASIAGSTGGATEEAVDTETARAKAAETTLTANLATETARAEAAEGTLGTAIAAETARAEAAETALGTGLATLTTGLTTETARAQAAEVLLAPLASPGLTGKPTAPTAAPGTNSQQIATTAYTTAAVEAAAAVLAAGIVTERERAVGIENAKAPLASPILTGTPKAPTPEPETNTDQIATAAFVQEVITAATTAAVAAVQASVESGVWLPASVERCGVAPPLGELSGNIVPDLKAGQRVFLATSSGAVAIQRPVNVPVGAATLEVRVRIVGNQAITNPWINSWLGGAEPVWDKTSNTSVNEVIGFSDDGGTTWTGIPLVLTPHIPKILTRHAFSIPTPEEKTYYGGDLYIPGGLGITKELLGFSMNLHGGTSIEAELLHNGERVGTKQKVVKAEGAVRQILEKPITLSDKDTYALVLTALVGTPLALSATFHELQTA